MEAADSTDLQNCQGLSLCTLKATTLRLGLGTPMDMWNDFLRSILGPHLVSSWHLDSSLEPGGSPYPTKSRGADSTCRSQRCWLFPQSVFSLAQGHWDARLSKIRRLRDTYFPKD